MVDVSVLFDGVLGVVMAFIASLLAWLPELFSGIFGD
jgi:hypothetical protein